jgi:hypothetical protein
MSVSGLQRFLSSGNFVQDLLEPKLINLVNGYKKQFIVLWAIA